MTAPFGQPEPFDPASVARPVAPPRPSSSRRLLPVVGAVALALVAFAGGYLVANATATTTRSTANVAGDNGGQAFGPGASFRTRNAGGAAGFGGDASGTVGSVSADQMTITTAAGGSRIVLLTPTTTVTQVSEATKAVSDITSGETVQIIGTSNPDGSVTATQVIIGNIGSLFGGRGFGGGGPNASPAAPSTTAQ